MRNQPAPMRDELIQIADRVSSILVAEMQDAELRDECVKQLRALAERAGGVADGPFAYCRACQAVGMSNCSNFDECSGATCITCHRPLNIAAPSPDAQHGALGDVFNSEKSWNDRDYLNVCTGCGDNFIGHKRQLRCRVCDSQLSQPANNERGSDA